MNKRNKEHLLNVGNFYKGQVFGMISDRLDSMEKKSDEAHQRMEDKIDRVERKVNYAYGVAAGIGVFFALIIEYIKSKIFK